MAVVFDPYAPSSADRYAAMAEIRAAGGVAPTSAGYYVAGFDNVAAALRAVDAFVGSFMDTSSLAEDDIPVSAIAEPRHGQIRRVINTVVAVHRTLQAEPFIRQVSARLTDEALRTAAQSGEVDLVATVVDPLPSAVIAHLLGVPAEHQERFRIWSDELLEAMNERESRPLRAFHPEFATYVDDLIASRRADPGDRDDIISRFLRTTVDGEHLSDRAVCTQTINLIIAGNETTRNLIGNALHTLAADPDLYAVVRADRAKIPAVVEESLRLDPPVQVLARTVVQDTDVVGCPVHAGDRVVFGLVAANRDEHHFATPEEFRLDRPNGRDHLAFGAGPHVCPGASLARLEATAALEAFCDRVAGFRLVDGFAPDPNPVFWAHGHRSLRVTLTPAGPDGPRPAP